MAIVVIVDVTMGGGTAKIEVDGDSMLKDLLSTLGENDTFKEQMSFAAVPCCDVSIDGGGGSMISWVDFDAEVPDGTTVGEAFPDQVIRLQIQQAVAPEVPEVSIKVFAANGGDLGAVSVPVDATGPQLLAALCERFEGDVNESSLQYPAKKAETFISLRESFGPGSILDRVGTAIACLLRFVQPKAPGSLDACRVQLAGNCTLKKALVKEVREAAVGAGNKAAVEAVEQSEWVAKQKAALEKGIKAYGSDCASELSALAEVCVLPVALFSPQLFALPPLWDSCCSHRRLLPFSLRRREARIKSLPVHLLDLSSIWTR